MLLNRENLKLHRPWILIFVAGCMFSIVALYNFSSGWFEFPGGSSTTGYLLGVVAGLIIIFEILLWPRKKLFRRWRIGRVRTWMCAHIWLGLLTVPLALIHAGFPWEGSLATITMILLLVVVGSGIFGLVLQQYLPRQMTNAVPAESLYSQVDLVARQMVVEADALLSAATGSVVGKTDWSELHPVDKADTLGVEYYVGASRSFATMYGKAFVTELPEKPIPNTELLRTAYETQIREFLELGKQSNSLLNDRSKMDQFFADLANKISDDARFLIDNLKLWCEERRQLDVQRSLHHWLHLWLLVHLPLSLALLVFLIWHAIVATQYSGVFSFF